MCLLSCTENNLLCKASKEAFTKSGTFCLSFHFLQNFVFAGSSSIKLKSVETKKNVKLESTYSWTRFKIKDKGDIKVMALDTGHIFWPVGVSTLFTVIP